MLGPSNTVSFMQQQSKEIFCKCCCPVDYAGFYRRTKLCFDHLLYTRTAVIISSVIAYYVERSRGNKPVVFAFLNIIGSLLLFYGLGTMVVFFHNVYSANLNLKGLAKLLLIKVFS